MSGVLTTFGSLSLADAIPAMATLDTAMRAADLKAKAELSGKLKGLVSVGAALKLPPPPTARAEAAIKVAAQIAASVQLQKPTLQLNANAKLQAELLAALAVTLPSFPLGTAGIAAYGYEGAIGELSGKLNGAIGNGLPGGTAQDGCYAVVLLAEVPAAIAALKQVLVSL